MHKKWKYDDTVCVGCGQKEERGEDFDYDDNIPTILSYEWFYSK